MSDYTQPQYWPVLKQLAGNIDNLDYFQILNLAQDCSPADVKQTYYAQSRALHPDNFYQLPDADLKSAVNKIYKRVTEAYNVLRDERRRKLYTQNINGPSRATLLRYTEAAEVAQKEQEKAEKEVTQNPKAKPLYLQAVQKMQTGNWDGAAKDLQTAMMFDPGNEKLKAIKEEVDKRRKGG
jgi:DnaJ-class molecular chaperone